MYRCSTKLSDNMAFTAFVQSFLLSYNFHCWQLYHYHYCSYKSKWSFYIYSYTLHYICIWLLMYHVALKLLHIMLMHSMKYVCLYHDLRLLWHTVLFRWKFTLVSILLVALITHTRLVSIVKSPEKNNM